MKKNAQKWGKHALQSQESEQAKSKTATVSSNAATSSWMKPEVLSNYLKENLKV